MTRLRIFISHISSETGLAQGLKQRLEKDFLGLPDIFVSSDQKTIQAGQKWLDEVDKALKEADLQIVLCSKESVGRPWVNFEAGAVWLRGIPVIPVCHTGMKPNDLPVPLSMLQGIAVSEPDGLRKLYDAIAAKLDINVPAVDFKAISAEFTMLEKKYADGGAGLERIEHPRIFCAASEQYAQPSLGFDLDVAILQKTFPGQVTLEYNLTRKRLRDMLTGERFDIVHLVLAVHPDTAELVFSPIDFASYKPATPKPESLAAEGFADLLRESQTKLVVLATCKALLLAVELSDVVNMVASEAEITGQLAAEWEECFYGLLAQGKSLYKAFDLTKSQIVAPMRAVRHKNIAFASESN